MAQNRIPPYRNGYCPSHRLIRFGTGYSPVDGYYEWRLPRATLRRWRSLIERAKRRSGGRILTPAIGWSTDRPIHIQVLAKQIHKHLAAAPGFSSHGMVFEEQQTAAIDAGNWSYVYANCGGYDAWLADARAEGFDRLPDGYPIEGERHHIIDYNPWDDEPEFGGAPAGQGSEAFTPPELPDEDDDMLAIKIKDSNTEHTVTLGLGTLSHMIESDKPENVKNQIRSRDDWTYCTVDEFRVLAARYGIAPDAWRFGSTTTGADLGPGKGGQFQVKNPETGNYWAGQTWTRAGHETNRLLTEIRKG